MNKTIEVSEDATASDLRSMLFHRARIDGIAPAILERGKHPLSFAGLLEQVVRVGRHLRARGIRRTDRVAVVVSERAQACVAYLGTATHAVAVPMNPAGTAEELAALLMQVNARAVIASYGIPALDQAVAETGLLLMRLTPDTKTAGLFSLPDAGDNNLDVQELPVGSDTLAAILMSSGTTSKPKAIPLTHQHILRRGQREATHLRMTPADVCLNFRPTHLTSNLSVSLISVLMSGGAVMLPNRFDADGTYADIADFGVTWFNAGPAHYNALIAAAPRHSTSLKHSRLRFVRSSSTPLDPALQARIEAVFGVPCLQNYATTETGLIACNPLPPEVRRPGTVGIPTGCEIRICDDNDQDLPIGSEGEILVRGPLVFGGYDADSARNAVSFLNGWFRTGDLGRIDDAGYLLLSGRRHDVINRGGQKVSPIEVEAGLCRHPAVADAVCVPQSHPTLGSVPIAAVVMREGHVFDPQAILLFLQGLMPAFKLPVRLIACDYIPRDPVGKILREQATAAFGSSPFTNTAPPQAVSEATKATAAESPLKRHLAALWAHALGVVDVDRDTDFFTLGGDSLQAVGLLMEVEELTGIQFDLDDMAGRAATVNAMAALVLRKRTEHSAAIQPVQPTLAPSISSASDIMTNALKELAQARSGWGGESGDLGHTAPVFLLNANGRLPPLFWCFNAPHEAHALAKALGPDQPLFILRSLNQIVTDGSLKRELEPALGRIYAAEIARLRPVGGLRLGGNCQGGRVMEEAARTLASQGRKIDLLAVLEYEIVKPFSMPLVMLFGAQSVSHNPFLRRSQPDLDWAKRHSAAVWDIVPGAHGQYFSEPFVQSFAARLSARLHEANSITATPH